MSCDKCAHCQQAENAVQDAANAYEVGTPLNHPIYGQVTYWRAAIEYTGDRHWVDLPGDNPDMVVVSGSDLTAI